MAYILKRKSLDDHLRGQFHDGGDLEGMSDLSDMVREDGPCTGRMPKIGDRVVPASGKGFRGQMRTSRDKDEKQVWLLQEGQHAVVVEVDKEGDFRLKNPAGEESEWTFRKHWNYQELEESQAYLRRDSNIERMENAAQVYSKKAFELMNVRDDDALDRELLKKVVVIRSARFYGCLSLPFSILFFLLFAISIRLQEDIANVYVLESGMRTVLTKDIEPADSIQGVWEWLNNTLVPTVFSQTDTQGVPYNEKMFWGRVLTNNQLQGPLVFEQMRSPAEPCEDSDEVGELILSDMTCYPEDKVSTEPFGVDANVTIRDPRSDEYAGGVVDRAMRENYYASAFQTEGGGRRLRFARQEYLYRLPGGTPEDGEAFAAYFYQNTPVELVHEHLTYLYDRHWLDKQTKQLRVKGLFLNAELGRPRLEQFHLKMSFSRGGGIFTYLTLETIFLETFPQLSTFDGLASIGAFTLWVIMLMVQVLMEIHACRRKLKDGESLRTFWTTLQWFLILLGFGNIITFIIQHQNRGEMVSKLQEIVDAQVMDIPADTNTLGRTFHDLAESVTSNQTSVRVITAMYLLLLMVRFFMAFQYQPRLAVVTYTLEKCLVDIIHFLLVLLPTFAAYAISGHLLFGRRIEGFATVEGAFGVCFKIMMEGEYDWPLLSEEHFWTTALWTLTFMGAIVILMLNMVLAIVLDVYTEKRKAIGHLETVWETVESILSQVWERRQWIPNTELMNTFSTMDKWVTAEDIQKKIPQIGQFQLDLLVRLAVQQNQAQVAETNDASGMAKESMKMALAEKIIVDKVNEALKELHEGIESAAPTETAAAATATAEKRGWLGKIAKDMGMQSHRMLSLQWHLQKLQWQWQAIEAVHGQGIAFDGGGGRQEEPTNQKPAAARQVGF